MKKFQNAVWKIVFIFFVSYSISYSQDEPCYTHITQDAEEPPAYLSPGWGQPKNIEVAIIYFDFPDGRTSNNEQPLLTSQLAGLNLDAVGEIGLTNTFSAYSVTTPQGVVLYTNAAKYERHDRWKMFFLGKTPNTQGYTGNAHPDYTTHHDLPECRDEAYGSMVDYWKEVSNNKITIVPAVTHPAETDYELRTGIVNRYIDAGGKKIIKYLTLPKNKYGTGIANAYFPNFDNFFPGTLFGTMGEDIESVLQSAYSNNEIDINVINFINNGGKAIFIFAGSHKSFKGVTYPPGGFSLSGCYVRNMNDKPDNYKCRIDGITNMMHEFGHLAFTWLHTISGRNDLMNVHNTKNINCPSHPNPILKLRLGWIEAVPLENSQTAELLPIETSNQCGIVTIYGKPSAAPDKLSGECYIIENRKRIGFDRELLDQVDYPLNNYNGGLLIWHYSPYTLFNYSTDCGSDFDKYIKFIPASLTPPIECGNVSPLYFFAHTENANPPAITTFDISRTYSAENLKTGIQITNIRQNDYGNVNSSISFNLQYTISEPPDYSYVIYPRNFGHTTDRYGKVFFHKSDENANFIFHEGSSMEVVTQKASLAPFKTRTRVSNPIVFKAAGYENAIESYITRFQGISTGAQYFDSLVAENIKIKNVTSNSYVLTVNKNYANNLFPINKIKNISFEDCIRNFYDIKLSDNLYSDIDLNDCSLLMNSCTIKNQVKTFNCGLYLMGDIKFTANGLPLDCILTNLTNKILEIQNYTQVTLTSDTYWSGINLTSSNIDIKNAAINNALIGIQSQYPSYFKVNNCVFNNSIGHGITLTSFHPTNVDICEINDNTFNCNPNFSYSAITCSDDEKINVQNNVINNIGQYGIALVNCPDANIYGNTISGGNSNDGYSTGIISYYSGGAYSCNNIYNCMQYGMLMDNSQPVLYNNKLENNGIGLYLTNNSHPLMTPGYTLNNTYEIGGFNKITNSAGPEIYCNNEKEFYSTPIIDNGQNIIEDNTHQGFELPDTLIFNSDINVIPSIIYCSGNFWGGNDPAGRLIPASSFSYKNFLEQFELFDCSFGVIEDDNSDLSESELLLGNYIVARYQNNTTAALDYAYDLFNLDSSKFSKVIPLNNIFYSSLTNNSSLSALETFYADVASENTQDTILSKKANNLMIETKVRQELLTPAMNDYNNILNTSSSETEIFYASIDKSRVLRLILDSLLAHYHGGGDNYMGQSVNTLLKDAVINVSNLPTKKDSKNISKFLSSNKFLNKLNADIQSKISNISNISEAEKKILILNSQLVQLAIRNYNPNIAAIQNRTTIKNDNVLMSYQLMQNYPNPFNPLTTIKYSLPKSGFVSIKIYDVVGRMVKELVSEFKEMGTYNINFDGSQFASGVYFYRIEANNFIDTKRMVLVK
ncbi:MAG: T9SS type A sorting domain-containing protein [Ignavibacteria bacterium]|nr:T9SS type A sorting domain-containing protein [Ignavibacteria bacterium]